jgi:hypothetical protein
MTRTDYWKLSGEKTLFAFLELIEYTVESNANEKVLKEQIEIDRHELFMKFAFHLASISTLRKGSSFSNNDKSKTVIDYSSIFVLIRTAFEVYLTYYFIYRDSVDEDEMIFRYNNWIIDGLNQRQKIASESNQTSKILLNDKEQIIKLMKEMKDTKHFSTFSEKEKQHLESTMRFIKPDWTQIAKKTGLDEYWAKTMYQYFSTYTHTVSTSIIQFKEATVTGYSQRILESFEKFLFAFSAMFVKDYWEYYSIKSQRTDDIEMIEAWESFYINMKEERPHRPGSGAS